MKLVNRSALVLRYREPFLRWAERAFEEQEPEDIEDLRGMLSVYLVPPDPNEEHESAPLENFFTGIFEHELESWCTDRSSWPRERTFSVFNAWFEVSAQSVVLDLASGEIRSEPS